VRRLYRIAVGLGGAVAVWVGFLAGYGWLGADCQRERAEARLAATMKARVEIGDLDLGLVTGDLGVDRLRIERDDRGLFRLEVARVDVDLWPVGLALLQDGVGDVRIRGARLEVTALGALDLRHGKGKPLRFDRIDIRDADLAIEAIRLVPGLARVAVHVDHAVAGATTLRTPMSWLFALRELDATVTLPDGSVARLQYARGVIHLSGSLLGAVPIDLPFEIPVLDPAAELDQLREMGFSLALELVTEAANRLLDPR
jgi:hypothetical protein